MTKYHAVSTSSSQKGEWWVKISFYYYRFTAASVPLIFFLNFWSLWSRGVLVLLFAVEDLSAEELALRQYLNMSSTSHSTPRIDKVDAIICCWHRINYSFLWAQAGKVQVLYQLCTSVTSPGFPTPPLLWKTVYLMGFSMQKVSSLCWLFIW